MSTTARRPAIDVANIPEALRERRQWVLWRTVERRGEKTKMPCGGDGRAAKSDDPSTWLSYEAVERLYRLDRQGRYAGIGFVFAADDPFCGVDLDGCRDPDTGEIAEWAKSIIDTFNTYTEVSPSGSGVKMFIRAKWPLKAGKNKKLAETEGVGGKSAGIEVYDRKRYFAVTGQRLEGSPAEPQERRQQIETLAREHWPNEFKRRGGAGHQGNGRHDQGNWRIQLARKRLATCEPAIQGKDGSGRAIHAACELFRCRLTMGEARELFVAEYNPRCEPPWDDPEIDHKLENAQEKVRDEGFYYDGRNGRAARKAGQVAAAATGKPTIVVDTDEMRVADEAIAALAADPRVYQRSGKLVHIVNDAEPPRGVKQSVEAPRIVPLPEPRLRELQADAALWVRETENETTPCHVPTWAVKAAMARGTWPGIRPLVAVVETPIIRADGSILHRPGYDAETGIIFEPSAEFAAVPDKPSRDDARLAAEILFEAVVDFPFAGPAHRSAWLAGLLTPLARFAFAGPSPLFLVDANAPGTGKGLLVDTIAIILTAHYMARMGYVHSDDEMRKRITSIALAGEPLLLLDNISGPFGTAALDIALTTTRWSDRILCASEMTGALTLQSTWYATANNVAIVGDTSRRICHIRLETDLENPEERDDFRHHDLKAWLRQNRPRLVATALTILRAYFAAGRPDMKLRAWGSYEDWSAVVRSAIVWCGLPDPAETRRELAKRSDREVAAQAVLIAGIEELDPAGNGVTVAEMLDAISEKGGAERYSTLRSALLDLVPAKAGSKLPSSRSVGMKLHHMRRRIIGGKQLDSRDGPRGKQLWIVEEAAPACGTTGTSGTTPDITAGARTHAHAHARESGQEPGSPATPSSPAPSDDDWHVFPDDPEGSKYA